MILLISLSIYIAYILIATIGKNFFIKQIISPTISEVKLNDSEELGETQMTSDYGWISTYMDYTAMDNKIFNDTNFENKVDTSVDSDVKCGIKEKLEMKNEINNGTLVPWLVSIIVYNNSNSDAAVSKKICGGALVSKKWVVTSAHCLWEMHIEKIGQILITIGIYRKSKNNKERFKTIAAQYFIHPDYERLKKRNISFSESYGIAMVRLKQPVNWKKYPLISPICLPKSEHQGQVSNNLVIMGWGLPENKKDPQFYFLEGFMEYNNTYCASLLGKDQPISAFKICVGEKNLDKNISKITCQNDNGEVLMRPRSTTKSEVPKWELVGVLSDGSGLLSQGDCGKLGIYTRVIMHQKWINKTMKNSKSVVPNNKYNNVKYGEKKENKETLAENNEEKYKSVKYNNSDQSVENNSEEVPNQNTKNDELNTEDDEDEDDEDDDKDEEYEDSKEDASQSENNDKNLTNTESKNEDLLTKSKHEGVEKKNKEKKNVIEEDIDKGMTNTNQDKEVLNKKYNDQGVENPDPENESSIKENYSQNMKNEDLKYQPLQKENSNQDGDNKYPEEENLSAEDNDESVISWDESSYTEDTSNDISNNVSEKEDSKEENNEEYATNLHSKKEDLNATTNQKVDENIEPGKVESIAEEKDKELENTDPEKKYINMEGENQNMVKNNSEVDTRKRYNNGYGKRNASSNSTEDTGNKRENRRSIKFNNIGRSNDTDDNGKKAKTCVTEEIDSNGQEGDLCRTHSDCSYEYGKYVCQWKIGTKKGKCKKKSCSSNDDCTSFTDFPSKCQKGACTLKYCYDNKECPEGYGCYNAMCKQIFHNKCEFDCDCNCDCNEVCFKNHCYCRDGFHCQYHGKRNDKHKGH